MAEYKDSTSSPVQLPSGEFPIQTHFDVLRRFMSVSRNGADPVETGAVEGQGVPPGAAQGNTAFLCQIGLLVEEKAGRFKPTAVAMQFINTQIADEGRGRRLLRSLIEKTWFGASARTLLRTERAAPFREEEVVAALASAASIPPDKEGPALRVLTEYLVYTGIWARPAPASSTGSDQLAAAESASAGSRSTTPVLPLDRGTELPRGVEPSSEREVADWEVIQTSEFYLKIQPKRVALKRLRKQLDLLDEKLAEAAKPER